MGKKIIIAFDSNPVPGVAWDYTIQIDGIDLVYPNGLTNLTFEYEPFEGTDPDKVNIRGNTSLTINDTLAFLVANYSTDSITYARVNDTIEVRVNTDLFTVVYINAENPSISITTEDVSSITTVNLKYFFEYKNIVGDTYFCEIFKKDYIGPSTEIHGTVILEKASSNTHLDPIRGGGATLELEANTDLTLEDLYSDSEQDFTVKIYKNNKIAFQGYLNPDGVFQDYVSDGWIITLDCVDGLGAIENLSFVQDNGLHFTGKMLAIDIVRQCLRRSGVSLPINVRIDLTYEGLNPSDEILREVYFDTNRYVRTDNDTIMSCGEVLKSILDVFKACVTQWDGEWYIYKPNDIFTQPIVEFHRYDINNNPLFNKTVNLNKLLGSQIDNFYPHHCTGNQRIEIKGGIGGFRLGYKYGFVAGLLDNPELAKNGNTLDYDGWVVNDPYFLLNDPLKSNGFYFKNNFDLIGTAPTVTSLPITVAEGDQISIKMDFNVTSNFGSSYIKMRIKNDDNYLNYFAEDPLAPFDDLVNANWTTDSSDTVIFYLHGKIGSVTFPLPKIVSDGNLEVSILLFQNSGTNSTTLISFLDVIPTQSSNTIEGEFHTVERVNRVSTIVKENQTVYNGDNAGVVYIGAIYNNILEPTQLWSRFTSADKFPILRIAAEEELRIAQRPMKVFSGDFYGYIPYLSLITINNIGKFMPIEWSYNTKTNITTCKSLELFVAELTDIVYSYTIDYGNVVKPTIK